MRTTRALLIAAALCAASLAGAAEKGFFGFGLRTEFDGSFWNPVLALAAISLIVPDSPTARSGIAVGDVVLELEGLTVPGAKDDQLDKLEEVLERKPRVGDQLRMKLRRANGEVYSIVLVAEPRKE